MHLKNSEKLEQKLQKAAKEKSRARRGVRIAAVISEALREINETPVLVGGAAVEFYTEGKYATKDIDMTAVGGEALWHIMEQLGFKKLGKDFVHQKLKIYVEFPSETLRQGERSDILDVDGVPLRIISIEDLVVDRLCSYKFWGSLEDGVNALILLELQTMDEQRLLDQARHQNVADALQAVQDIYVESYRTKLSKKKAGQKLQEWLRQQRHFR